MPRFNVFLRPNDTAGWCSPGLEPEGSIVVEVADTAQRACEMAWEITDRRRSEVDAEVADALWLAGA